MNLTHGGFARAATYDSMGVIRIDGVAGWARRWRLCGEITRAQSYAR